jgi:hypothetical protein
VAAAGIGGAEAGLTAPAAATGVGAAVPGAGVAVAVLGVGAAIHGGVVVGNTLGNIFKEGTEPGGSGDQPQFKKPKAGATGKAGSTDIPSWAEGQRPYVGESGSQYAERLLDGKYGKGNYDKGPTSEYNKLRKYGDRHFE